MKPVQNVQNMKSVQYAQDSYVANFSRLGENGASGHLKHFRGHKLKTNNS